MTTTMTDSPQRPPARTPARILLADDHELVRQGLKTVLKERPEWEVCGEATTGRDAVKLATELHPDVVVLDISMPELNGLEAARQILKEAPKTEVLILTVHDSENLIQEVLDAGARGYILKSDASKHLIAAIDSLRNRKPFFTSRISEVLLNGYLSGRGPLKGETTSRLTPRERQIVQLLAEGKSNKEVASTLNISVKTAETHRTNIMRKLDLHSISGLVRYAIRNNIIQP
ncbi:MAG TPA: response regulator transcription factor [Vicinamibacteria bacterium]|jgi:DNA-binding NarL/FixJ family response regulator